jgi:DNA invertase Pin-like site-specific DNA recombinase
MLSVFADFERAMIVERTKAGMARARAQGKVIGRPRRPAAGIEDAVRASLADGMGICRAAKVHGCGVGTVQRIKRALQVWA